MQPATDLICLAQQVWNAFLIYLCLGPQMAPPGGLEMLVAPQGPHPHPSPLPHAERSKIYRQSWILQSGKAPSASTWQENVLDYKSSHEDKHSLLSPCLFLTNVRTHQGLRGICLYCRLNGIMTGLWRTRIPQPWTLVRAKSFYRECISGEKQTGASELSHLF